MTAPLKGIRIAEFEAPGPVAWAGMMLAGMGAEVIRIVRPGSAPPDPRFDWLTAGRESIGIDLKDEAGKRRALDLVATCDVLLEGMRPGVMERLGLGPEACFAAKPSLVYGRMTGWGQDGPRAQAVGHDINFMAVTGALHAIGTKEAPVVPINVVGDFGGGGMLLVSGVLAALVDARGSGRGHIVDAAMVDGTLALMAVTLGRFQGGRWKDEREANLVDGGAPFYRCYRTKDGRFMAVGAIEARFYAALLRGLGLDASELPEQNDRTKWPQLRARFEQAFADRTRDEWERVFEGTEACVTPVLSLAEVTSDPHLVARGNFVPTDEGMRLAAAPRFR